jgi:hypothetical protein
MKKVWRITCYLIRHLFIHAAIHSLDHLLTTHSSIVDLSTHHLFIHPSILTIPTHSFCHLFIHHLFIHAPIHSSDQFYFSFFFFGFYSFFKFYPIYFRNPPVMYSELIIHSKTKFIHPSIHSSIHPSNVIHWHWTATALIVIGPLFQGIKA